MSATILDGKTLAAKLREQMTREVAELRNAGRPIKLVAVMVGEPPASMVYARSQGRACEAAGIEYDLRCLDSETSQQQLEAELDALSADESVTGIILQMPLPVHMNARQVQLHINPEKDVEGVHPLNIGRLFGRTGHVAPCTALAAVEMVRSTGIDLKGQEAVVVGHSQIVGKPIAMILLQSPDAAPTVRICHVATCDLAAHTRAADVLLVATGVRQSRWEAYAETASKREHSDWPDLSPLITAEMVKPGAVVIDVAINRIPVGLDGSGRPILNDQGKIKIHTTGDVDFEAVKDVAGVISPVPGGVGPVTVAMLLRNTIACARRLGRQAD